MSKAKSKNLRVSYEVSATINLGDFNNIKPSYSVSADVPEGVHPSVVRAEIKRLADNWMEEDVAQALKERRG